MDFNLFFILLVTFAKDQTEAFYPFGTSNGDSVVQAGDDTAQCFPVSSQFPLFTTTGHTQICLNSNGFITIDTLVTGITASLGTTAYALLVPFNKDLRSSGGNIFHRSTTDAALLASMDQDIPIIQAEVSSDVVPFKSKEAIIMTYNNVAGYSCATCLYKYQAVLLTDYVHTWVILDYDGLATTDSTPIGFGDPACNAKQEFPIGDYATINSGSNIGQAGTGKYAFLLSSGGCGGSGTPGTDSPIGADGWGLWGSWSACQSPNVHGPRSMMSRVRTCTSPPCVGENKTWSVGSCLDSGSGLYRDTYPTVNVANLVATKIFPKFRIDDMALSPSYRARVDVFATNDTIDVPELVITANTLVDGTGAFTEPTSTAIGNKYAFIHHVAREGNLEYTSRSNAELYMDTNIKILPSPSDKVTLSHVWSFKRDEDKIETLFVHQEVLSKTNTVHMSISKISDMPNVFFPGRITEDLLFSTAYLGYGTNIELKVYFDSNFQTDSITNVVLPRPDAMLFEKYSNQNAAKFKLDAVFGTSFLPQMTMDIANKRSTSNGQSNFHYYQESIGCCDTYGKQIFQVNRTAVNVISQINGNYGWKEPGMRIKSKHDGRCLQNGPNGGVIAKSKCRENYILTQEGRLVSPQDGQVKFGANYPVYFQHDNIRVLHKDFSSALEYQPATGYVVWKGTLSIFDEYTSAQNKFKLIQGYTDEVMEKIGMKSILQLDTELGSTILLCEPTADLGQKSNCYFSTDKGQKWKGVHPMMTSLSVYLPSTKLFYGFCYRTKHHCSYDIVTNRLGLISEADYINLLGDLSLISTSKLDDIDLPADSEIDLEFPEMRASSNALFILNDAGSHVKSTIFRN
eukprot:TCONS_00069721-protein